MIRPLDTTLQRAGLATMLWQLSFNPTFAVAAEVVV